MKPGSSFAQSALLVAVITGTYWLLDLVRLRYGIPVRSGSMVWGTIGVIVVVTGAIGAWRGARWAPEVWLLGVMILLARVVHAVILARPAWASASPMGLVIVVGLWLAMAIWACRVAWVARQARTRAP